MSDVYVRRRLVVGAGAAALVGLFSYKACGSDDAPANAAPSNGVTSSSANSSSPARSATPTSTPSIDSAGLTHALNAGLGARAANVSVAAFDRRSGATFSYHPAMTNVCASIAKVLILVSIIRTRRIGGTGLTAGDQDLAEDMITESDNAAASALFRRAGYAPGIQRVADSLGMRSTKANSFWGLTTTTAGDQVTLMRAISYGHPLLQAADRAYILGLMGRVDPGQSFGIGTLPAGTSGVTVHVKNGWLPYDPGLWHDNSVGHVQGAGRDYAAAILSTGNATDVAGRALLTKAAGLVYTHLGH